MNQPAAAPPTPKPLPTVPASVGNLHLNRMVMERVKRMVDKPRRPGFHPSELHAMCPVFHYFKTEAHAGLASDAPQPHYDFLMECLKHSGRRWGHLRLEFEIGDAVHQMVQYHLGVLGLLWGAWKCPHCHAITKAGFMPRVEVPNTEGQPVWEGAPCDRCNGLNRRERHSWIYLEPMIAAPEWDVTGNCDGDLRVSRGPVAYRMVLEIKSMNQAEFSGKTNTILPKPEHVTQASMYAHFLGASHIYFIYVCKDQVSKWKEFMVPPDPMAIAQAKTKMTAALTGLNTKAPPLHARICPSVNEQEARACPAVVKCFGCKPQASLWDNASNEEVFGDI